MSVFVVKESFPSSTRVVDIRNTVVFFLRTCVVDLYNHHALSSVQFPVHSSSLLSLFSFSALYVLFNIYPMVYKTLVSIQDWLKVSFQAICFPIKSFYWVCWCHKIVRWLISSKYLTPKLFKSIISSRSISSSSPFTAFLTASHIYRLVLPTRSGFGRADEDLCNPGTLSHIYWMRMRDSRAGRLLS